MMRAVLIILIARSNDRAKIRIVIAIFGTKK